MKWRRVKKNRDVIDARGASGSGGGGRGGLGGIGGGLPIPGGLPGTGGIGLVVIVIVYIAIQVLSNGGGGTGFDIPSAFDPSTQAPGQPTPAGIPRAQDPQKDIKDFSVFVFTDVQRTWERTFRGEGNDYDHAQLVLYSGAVDTGGCGHATSAVGPFYCPADQRVYLDLTFYDDMTKQLNAPGDFAWAYVIAHEMGHHVQQQTGTSQKVEQESRANSDDANALSVRLELQADCYAGVWAHTEFKQGDLQQGDLQEAFTATEAVGDDRLQRQATGSVNPDTFTHGTSEQRRGWFTKGYKTADPGACDTFSADEL
jgi:predicted metalloprotease